MTLSYWSGTLTCPQAAEARLQSAAAIRHFLPKRIAVSPGLLTWTKFLVPYTITDSPCLLSHRNTGSRDRPHCWNE